MAFIRQSKFRHVFGTAARKENCYENFRVTNCAFEGNFIAANKKFVAACVETGGSGTIIVFPTDKTGRLDVNIPKISAHKEYVTDMQWNPYNDSMLATCSEDGRIRIWVIPDHGPLMNWDESKAVLDLDFHEKRCVQIAWHPTASNILLSVSQEPKVVVWNLDEGDAITEIDAHPDIIWNASWSMNGDKIVTSCKDKNFRIFNARTGELLQTGKGHEGSKAQRVIFTFNDKYLFSTGFSRMSERQYAAWDPSNMEQLNLAELDTANGCLIPYYDPDTQICFIGAKGDSVIRYYELVDGDPYFHYISTYQSSNAQRGLSTIPKRNVNVNSCEIVRFYKLHGSKTGYIEPIAMEVPRKSELFQDDIYPDCVSEVPALEAEEWAGGKNAVPNRISMKTLFKSKDKGKSSSGGLKKGGLKGLKAKKGAKDAKKSETDAPTSASEPEKPKPVAAASVEKEEPKASPVMQKRSASPAVTSAASGADAEEVKKLKNEVKKLTEGQVKLQKEVKGLNDKLKDYDKLTGDIKLLCDAVKKNDERIASLEALVQEESDNET